MNVAKEIPKVVPLDDEERELIESTETDDEWKSVSDLESRKKEIIQAAKVTNRKKPITIRLSQADIDALKLIAADEGLPYQTLISSILHKYSVKKLRF